MGPEEPGVAENPLLCLGISRGLGSKEGTSTRPVLSLTLADVSLPITPCGSRKSRTRPDHVILIFHFLSYHISFRRTRDGSLTAGHGFTNSCIDEMYEYRRGPFTAAFRQIPAFPGVGGYVNAEGEHLEWLTFGNIWC